MRPLSISPSDARPRPGVAVWLAAAVLLLAAPAVAAQPPGAPDGWSAVWTTIELPGTVEGLAEAAGLVDPPPTSILLRTLIRVVHANPPGRQPVVDRVRLRVLDYLRATAVLPNEPPRPITAAPPTRVPLPLPPNVWAQRILKQRVDAGALGAAIVASRPASLLYYGLSGLDVETLAFFAPGDALDAALEQPDVFAAFGGALRIRGGRVELPGGAETATLWTSLVGARPDRPVPFIRALLGRDSGRLAWFFHTLSELPPSALRYALGADLASAEARASRFPALYDAVIRCDPAWNARQQPFARPSFDAGLLLGLARIDDAGRLLAPLTRGRLLRAFGVTPGRGVSPDQPNEQGESRIDAADLCQLVLDPREQVRHERFEAFAYAQRLVTDGAPVTGDAVVAAVLAYRQFPALALTLERMGLAEAAILESARTTAERLSSIGDGTLRTMAIEQFQGALAILDRLVARKTLDRPAAARLLQALLDVPVSKDGYYDGGIAAWIAGDLFPATDVMPGPAGRGVEEALLARLAGPRPRDPAAVPLVIWEGTRYRLDPHASELARLKQVRARQGGPALDRLFGQRIRPPSSALPESKSRHPMAGLDETAAEALATLAYAIRIGDPDSGFLLGGNPATQHSLGPVRFTGDWHRPGAWRVAEVNRSDGPAPFLEGSLLALDIPFGMTWLRRLSSDLPLRAPRLTNLDRDTFAQSVAMMEPSAFDDVSRDVIASAIAEGEARLGAASGADALVGLAAAAGIYGWRLNAVVWAARTDPAGAADLFTLSDFVRLGEGRVPRAALDRWGVSSMPLDGCLCRGYPRGAVTDDLGGRRFGSILATAMPDLNLRAACELAARRLPAALAPGLLAYATQDLIDQAQPAHLDDWFALASLARHLRADLFDDYVAALTANGPLLPERTVTR